MDRWRVILRFFYAMGKVKSTDGAEMMAGSVSRRLAPGVLVVLAYLLMSFSIAPAVARAETPLTILDDSLPTMSAGEQFNFTFHAAGGARPYHWSVEGKLPDGLSMSYQGVLSGRPAKSGPLTITVILTDSGRPAHPVKKSFQTAIMGSLLLEWLDPPKVHDGRIDGAVQVSNGSKDVFDLTVIVVAVAGNGRATALGYQHFPLKPGTTNFPITFGNTLPDGAYVIHADAVAEISARKNILRQRLQTPEALRVAVGP